MSVLKTSQRSATSGGQEIGRPGPIWAAPAVAYFGLFALFPLAFALWLSFTKWSGLGSPKFNGLDNWMRLASDPILFKSIGLTFLFTALAVLVQTPLSLLLGVWAAGKERSRAVMTAIFFVPLLLSSAAISVLWRALLDPNFGVPNQFPGLFGDGNLLGKQASAIAVITIVIAWQFIPFYALIYQGAARSIPQMLYQAALVDGAGRVRAFFSITLPQLRNTIVTSTILMVVYGLTTFETILILTNGGPGTDTTITAFYMYDKGFRGFEFGYASAIALVLVVIAAIVSLIMVKVSGYQDMRSKQEGM